MTDRQGTLEAGGFWHRWRYLLPALAVYALCRIPSFFEPHWYTDEAGYATTAREMLRGAQLYTQAWTNKPPLHIWAVALPLSLFGTREAGLHALTFVAGLLALIAFALLARRLLVPGRARLAAAVFGIAIGLPLFQAELLVPESLLIVPVTWAALLVLTNRARIIDRVPGGWLWAAGAGGLMGVAVGFQQTALADTVVFGVIIALIPGIHRRLLTAYCIAFLAGVAAWLLPSLAVAGAPAVAFALIGF